MNIKHAVITSADRDDLKDGGSIIGSKCKSNSWMNPTTTLETLIPTGYKRNIDRTIEADPEVVSHNGKLYADSTWSPHSSKIRPKFRSVEIL
jgi:lipoic acid synthetase